MLSSVWAGLKHLLSGLLDFAQLQLDLVDLLARIFQLRGHGRLGVRGDFGSHLGGILDAILKALVTASRREATVPARVSILVLLCVCAVDIPEISAHLVHLRFQLFVLLLILSVLEENPDDQANQTSANTATAIKMTFMRAPMR